MYGSFQGADENKFQAEYENLKRLIENAHPHSSLTFKNFSIFTKEAQTHSSQKQNAEMIKAIQGTIDAFAKKEELAGFSKWLQSGNVGPSNPCPVEVIDQIFVLMKEVQLAKRLPLVDLLRLITLGHQKACIYMLQIHFEDIQETIIGPAAAAISTKEKKILFLYAYMLKMLGNCFVHKEAAQLLLSSSNHYAMISYLLTTSFDIPDAMIVYSAAILAHNMMVCSENRKVYEELSLPLIEGSLKAMKVEKLDEASFYWLGYCCALVLYLAPKDIITATQSNAEMKEILGKMVGSSNNNIKNLGMDIQSMLK